MNNDGELLARDLAFVERSIHACERRIEDVERLIVGLARDGGDVESAKYLLTQVQLTRSKYRQQREVLLRLKREQAAETAHSVVRKT